MNVTLVYVIQNTFLQKLKMVCKKKSKTDFEIYFLKTTKKYYFLPSSKMFEKSN